MRIHKLLRGATCDVEIGGIAHQADKVRPGDLFFCLKGSKHDGHDYVAIAERNGAAAICCAHPVQAGVPCIVVPDTRRAFAKAASALYGNPAKKLQVFGITGTNGKTTTSYILAQILRAAGKNVGLIGTNCVEYAGESRPAQLTTPDPLELYATLADMLANGVECVVMEVSAHALALQKTAGIRFAVAGFTNLSQDHLDFFGNMEAYARAKKSLFSAANAKQAVINADDDFGRTLLSSCRLPVLTYGVDSPADVFGIDLKMSAEGLSFVINARDDIGTVRFALPGRFNMYNTLCAAAMAHAAGVDLNTIICGIKAVRRVDGRYNVINAADYSVIIDFAHTDDGLKNIIASVREFAPARLITVFGCGGDRDREKRPLMGAAAAQSDLCVLTSDNPRSEDPSSIIDEIAAGVPPEAEAKILREPDRKAAIRLALGEAKKGDIVLIAGKGAEQYQEVRGVRHPYNDEAYVMQLLSGKNDD